MGRKYPFKTHPRPHQVKALRKLVRQGGGGLFAPMRSGKTKVAIDWACAMHLKHGVRRVLVVTHTPTTFGVWKSEIRKHCPLKYDMDVVDYPDDPTADILFLITNVQQVFSRQSLYNRKGKYTGWEPVDNGMLKKWRPEVIMVDESTCIGDPTAVQSRHLYKLQKHCGVKYKLIISGTPLHRKLIMAFGQFKFLDDTIFGTSWGAFKTEYCLFGGWDKNKLIKYINVKRFRKKIEPHIFQMRHVPKIPPVQQIIPVTLEPKARELYEQMQRDRVVRVAGEDETTAALVVTMLLKEAQMASGFIRSDSGKWYRTSSAKRRAYGDRLRDYEADGKSKVVVFSRFLPTLRDIALESKSCGYKVLLLHGGMKHEDRERSYARFAEATGRWVFVSQISTGSMGIDLSEADTCLYYSLTESLLHYDQSMARIRKYKETRVLSYDYLLAERTIDELMYMALHEGLDLVNFVMKHKSLIHWEEEG
jgi:superfamily II DNA or RNA helicase